MKKFALHALCCLLFLLSARAPGGAAEPGLEIQYSSAVRKEPFSGRVYLFFSKQAEAEPRHGPNWFRPEPFVAVDIENWKPGEPLTVNPSIAKWMLAYPKPLAELDLTGYRVQAVARFNPFERGVGNGTGNGYSETQQVAVNGGRAWARLTIDKLVEEPPFPENRWCRLLTVDSPCLRAFHGRSVTTRGTVLLPASYFDAPERRYPVIFSVPGFGGNHLMGVRGEPIKEQNPGGVEFIRVALDPNCALGHHVFADSENNGPVGRALVEEFLPELDRQYRTIAAPTARFLTGHSSGGWSTLWLQVTYPKVFGGTWSTAPDPVDFRDFQRIDMYRAGENMYRDAEGKRRPLARRMGQVMLWYDDFDRLEETLGHGGQLHSFEAAFGRRADDGRPERAWDRKTGAVDLKAVENWRKFDIRLILEERIRAGDLTLSGKLHVIMGDEDTFYLEGATRLLQQSLAELEFPARVELVAGKDHFNLFSPELVERIRREMIDQFLKHHPAQ
jgi:Putative esterase